MLWVPSPQAWKSLSESPVSGAPSPLRLQAKQKGNLCSSFMGIFTCLQGSPPQLFFFFKEALPHHTVCHPRRP